MDTQTSYKALLRQSAQRELERLRPNTQDKTATQGARAVETVNQPTPRDSALEDMSVTANAALMERMKRAREAAQSVESPEIGGLGGLVGSVVGNVAGGNVGPFQVTQRFGVRNPGIEVFSGGINTGLDIGTPEGTPLYGLPGQWEVTEVYNQAKGKGRIGNSENSGYGNSVLLTNLETGEQIRTSHLSGSSVKKGQILKPGAVFGATGATGNVTGAHLDLELRNAMGKLVDPMTSPYVRALLGGRN
jgi:murein DD-endopeptidase MepM/ murein hydrolase activator NlpD